MIKDDNYLYVIASEINHTKPENQRRSQSQFALDLLRYAIKEKLNIDPAELIIEKDEHGKPFFRNCQVKFNLSHCDKYAVCAISPHKVGVDIEPIQNIEDKILFRFVGKSAETALEKTLLWTTQESIGKMVGVGLLHRYSHDPNLNGFLIKHYFELKDHVVTLCAESPTLQDSFEIIAI